MLSANLQNRLDTLLSMFRSAAASAQPGEDEWELQAKGDLIFVFVDARRPDTETVRLVFQIRTNGRILARDRDNLWTEVTWLKSEGVEEAIAASRRRDKGEETLAEIGRSYNVSPQTIGRLAT